MAFHRCHGSGSVSCFRVASLGVGDHISAGMAQVEERDFWVEFDILMLELLLAAHTQGQVLSHQSLCLAR